MATIAVAWFPKETYAELRAAQVDSDNLPATWEEWRQRIEQQLQRAGMNINTCTKVDLQIDALRAFCMQRGMRMDRPGRTAFAAAVAAGAFPLDNYANRDKRLH